MAVCISATLTKIKALNSDRGFEFTQAKCESMGSSSKLSNKLNAMALAACN